MLPLGKMNSGASLTTVFASSFLAATLLPGGSEIVLFAYLQRSSADVGTALFVATLGNTLGGLTSYLVGRLIPQREPLKGIKAIQRHGSPVLLLSWVPIIGDALCVAAGWVRINVGLALLFMALGKFARYAALTALSVY